MIALGERNGDTGRRHRGVRPVRPARRWCWRRRIASSERRQAPLTWKVKTRSSGWREKLDREDVVVLLGAPTADASRLYAMTVATGDPSWAGALAGVALGPAGLPRDRKSREGGVAAQRLRRAPGADGDGDGRRARSARRCAGCARGRADPLPHQRLASEIFVDSSRKR